ncbi:MAG: nickel pincer cofactor biosynthesis protein LarB [Chloroflexi bacterium]|nr:nickel pincer cofactor biosynthesis protein LarB [Chloroflexota bacterium]
MRLDHPDVPWAVPDFARHRRKGIPEVILADRKAPSHTVEIVARFLEREGRAILSRVPAALEAELQGRYGGDPAVEVEWLPETRAMVLRRAGFRLPTTGGRVGVLTAGTSDVPVAEEAALVCRETGCQVRRVYDVGVAGLHRLFEPLRDLLAEFDADVLVVVAGMDGALPSVVSGLVDVPVVGIPTSVGYGIGGEGVAALYSMLQTCAPGLAVVNIDNGIGGGAMAALIANRAARARLGEGVAR